MDILGGILGRTIIIIIAGITLCLAWTIITYPYFKYKLYNKKNKLQWRCEETWDSRERRKNGESDTYECFVSFRILPLELNKFVRIFANNEWHNPFHEHKLFKSEGEFKEFVKDWKTYGDWKQWVDKENGVLWYEP